MSTLGDELPKQMDRVTAMIPSYAAIGAAGIPGIMMMQASLSRAAKAIASGDLVEMIRAYEDLKGFEE